MKKILLKNKNIYALVDNEDYQLIKLHNWHVSSQGYAVRYSNRKCIFMHREILGLKYGDKLEVDHINHNKVDNRRCNIRICNRSINSHNKKTENVWKRKDTGKWTTQITINYKVINLGCFKTKKEAVEAYKTAKRNI